MFETPAPALWRTFLFVLLAVVPGRPQLVRDWRAVRTTHFELISRCDPAKTGPLLLDLEWARSVFETNFGLKSRFDRQVLLLVPDSPFDYEQISPSKFSAGYFLGTPWRDTIVLKELFNARHGLFHEYTHLVLHHQGGRWPAWFNEGTAEFYASMRRTKEGVDTGTPPSGRLPILRKGAWVPIAYLTDIENGLNLPSPDAVNRFYAQSWLYVHMLHLAPAYRDRFSQFRALMADGARAEEALGRVYAKSLVQFDEDAREWVRQERFPTERLQTPPEVSPKVDSTVIGPLDVEIARATVAASGPGKSQAAPEYASLARTAGDGCGRQAALGDLAFAARLFREASMHYREALRCGVKNDGIVQGLESAMSYRPDLRVEELESVVALGGGGRSHYLLGVARFSAKDYEGALREFERASGLAQPEEFRMRRLKAMSLAALQRLAEAQQVAQSLKELARDANQRQAAQRTVDDVQSGGAAESLQAAPVLRRLARLDGDLIRVDCMGERARLWVRSGSEIRKLLIADLKEINNGSETKASLALRCGEQHRSVAIRYQEQHDPATETAGRIRYLEFR
jgi:tetratricopeptide (TPR) repeat protein